MQLTYPLPILFQEAMPTGVGADVMLPVGEGVMGCLVAPGVVGEPVPCKTGESSATMNIHMHIVMKLFSRKVILGGNSLEHKHNTSDMNSGNH